MAINDQNKIIEYQSIIQDMANETKSLATKLMDRMRFELKEI
jgi:hypothetical protein